MERRMHNYFKAEKKAGLFLSILGILMLMSGISLFLWAESPRWQWLGIPLLAIAIPQLLAGISIYFRTDQQVRRLSQLLAEQPKTYVQEEVTRMEQVNRSLRIYISISLSLFIIGISLLMLSVFGQLSTYTMGFGGGLAFQTAIMLAFDLFAEMRAALYTSAVLRFKHHPDQPL